MSQCLEIFLATYQNFGVLVVCVNKKLETITDVEDGQWTRWQQQTFAGYSASLNGGGATTSLSSSGDNDDWRDPISCAVLNVGD